MTKETRLVPCDACDGTGEITVNDTPFPDDPYRVKEIRCEVCEGLRTVERAVEPVEVDDGYPPPCASPVKAADIPLPGYKNGRSKVGTLSMQARSATATSKRVPSMPKINFGGDK